VDVGELEWDEEKRRKNIEKHGLDFIDAACLFEGPYLDAPARTVGGEARRIAVGLIGSLYATVIYTLRGATIRVISLRSARHAERDEHQKVFGRPPAGTEGER
jgi:hypothetical protein